MRIQVLAPDMFRIRMCERDDFPETALVRYGIVRFPAHETPCTMTEDDDAVTIRTEKIVLRADRSSGQVTISYPHHRLSINPVFSDTTKELGAEITLAPDERFYGLGDESRETIMKRGRTTRIRPTKEKTRSPVPFVMSSLGWGLFICTTLQHDVDLGCTDPDKLSFILPESQLDFVWFAGNGYPQLLDQYTSLTGRPTLLPIWAYGLTFICNQQSNAREAIEDVLKFRHEGIPCDMVGLELNWMEKQYDRSTSKNWHPQRFFIPNWSSKGQHTFIGTLEGMGFKLSLWLCCDYDLSVYEELRLRQERLPETGTEQDDDGTGDDDRLVQAEAWYEHLKKFVDQGVKSFKLSESNIGHLYPDRQWGNGMMTHEMELLYPVLLSKQMHDGFREQTGLRPMIYSAESFVGIQQYAALFKGGIDQQGEQRTLIAILNDSLSGLHHVANEMNIHSPESIHFGFFQSWCKVNSWAYWRHPCLLESHLRDIFKKYAKLRYRLIPYIYSAAHTAALTGMPMIRAMPLVYSHDPDLANHLTQYMFGGDFLVAAFTNRVNLPAGEWIDYWSGQRHRGSQELECDLPEYVGGPLFLRAGAIVPMWPEMDYIGQKSVARMSLHVYPYGFSEYTLYEDDGTSFGYLTGAVATTSYTCDSKEGQTVVRVGRRVGQYSGMPAKRSYDLFVYTNKKPSRVTVNEEEYKEAGKARKATASLHWFYDRLSGCVQLHIEESAAERVQIELTHGSEPSRGRTGAIRGKSDAPARKETERTSHTAGEKEPSLGSHGGEKHLEIGLERGDWDKTRSALERLLKERTGQARDEDDIHAYYLYLSGLLVRFMKSKDWAMKDVLDANYEQFLRLQTMTSREESRLLLFQAAEQVTAYSRNARNSSMHPLVQRLTGMVNEGMKEQFFTLSDAAERLHVNASHLSRLFKQETGVSFSDYVLEKKMTYAKQLMQSGGKVAEVAASTGFRDTGHFIRVYRKYWGLRRGD
ncbi:TIM-barrel domain-containing protein [Paenibacillus hodogayensis]|uniref:TIM-barrel domain-containing protein n=1 Tax=Paenibacillus hodogayensis TaxID=279208 RepID=A0ABV5W7Y0_9BACL